jgi:hypothetical protein
MPGCMHTLKALSAQKQISAGTSEVSFGMLEVCLGMSVVCPGMLEYNRMYPVP